MKRIILSFMLLIITLSFAISQNSYKDCGNAFSVCKFGTYYFSNVAGTGEKDDLNKNLCRNLTITESNSTWLKFKVKKDGIITFLITPYDMQYDIDFILYSTRDMECGSKTDIRCMATGENIGDNTNNNCLGATGLDFRSLDLVELQGCKYSYDNFLKFLDAKAGETYTLFVNNYNSKSGFSILFDGTGDLEMLNDCMDNKNVLDMQLLSVFPNPARNVLNVSLYSMKKEVEAFTIEIMSLSGQVVSEMKYQSNPGNLQIPLDISTLVSGSYLLRIKNSTGNLIERFVKN